MEKYNGWTNYQTWRVHLEMFDGCIYNDGKIDADWCKDCALELIEAQSEGLARDYALFFLVDVDWEEIAIHVNENNGFEEGVE